MPIEKPSKAKITRAFNDAVLAKQDYLVTQANDLAKSFGNLNALAHKLLDYCIAHVQPHDKASQEYKLDIKELIAYLGFNKSGKNYQNIMNAFTQLNARTAVILPSYDKHGEVDSVTLTSLFDFIKIEKNGTITYAFHRFVAPYIFELRKDFYSFRLLELSRVKSKYTLSFLKLWNANSLGKWSDATKPNQLPPSLHLEASLDDWKTWLLGVGEDGKPKDWSAGRFKQKALMVALEEISTLYPTSRIVVTPLKNGRRITGFTVDIQMFNTNIELNHGLLDEGKAETRL